MPTLALNEGDGLNAEQSARLAQRLETALGDGSIERLLEQLEREERFNIRDAIDPADVAAFIRFLRTCGGFEIGDPPKAW
jgi:hypothetical protein